MTWYEEYGIKKPYYADDAVCIVHADCRQVLPLIPDKSIDVVLTDPPYGDRDIGLELGAVQYMEKPLDMVSLLSKIRNVFDKAL